MFGRIRQRIAQAWRAAPVAVAVLALALLAAGFFGWQTAARWAYWNDPAHRDQDIAGWMTPGYVARSWHVPREVMIEALGPEADRRGPRNLEEIARERGIPLEQLVAEIEATIAAFRAEQAEQGSR